MDKKKLISCWLVGLLIAVATVSVYGISAQSLEGLSANQADKPRSDVIKIDTLKIFGGLEKPEVVFLHDLHTDALEKKNKDCSACHISGKNFEVIPDTLKSAVERIDMMSPKFKRLRDISRKEVMDIYHANCIECHTNMMADGEKAGPVTCGECHKKETVISSRQPMGFDNSLHFRHTKAHEKKCELCHHEFDTKTKQLVYVKEKEGSCRHCHKKEQAENRISMQLASHLSCIDCHKKTIAQKKKAGPVKCEGCHDLQHQEMTEKVIPVPRMERKQPDAVLIKTGNQEDLLTKMDAVPFDHKAHETYNNTCRVCHHESMDQCGKCHTLKGTKEGNHINTERAMHHPGDKQSCTGCHVMKQDDKKCAGCHVFMEKARRNESSASCVTCHMFKLPEAEGQKTAALLSKDEMTESAAKMLLSRKPVTSTYPDEDIPEKVIIKDLANKYKPAELPHRKMVATLVNNIKDNKLANYFHREEGTLCQGCHHNSPPAKKPSRCSNCHSKPFDEKNPFRPGLSGAYHIQCMGCHKEMGIEKIGCTDCHKERTEN